MFEPIKISLLIFLCLFWYLARVVEHFMHLFLCQLEVSIVEWPSSDLHIASHRVQHLMSPCDRFQKNFDSIWRCSFSDSCPFVGVELVFPELSKLWFSRKYPRTLCTPYPSSGLSFRIPTLLVHLSHCPLEVWLLWEIKRFLSLFVCQRIYRGALVTGDLQFLLEQFSDPTILHNSLEGGAPTIEARCCVVLCSKGLVQRVLSSAL